MRKRRLRRRMRRSRRRHISSYRISRGGIRL